jgi:hypothetical protein
MRPLLLSFAVGLAATLGGATHDVLRNTAVPVLMMH